MRKRPPQKGILSYFLPFFLLGIIIAAGIYYINTSSNLSFTAKIPATLEIVESGVKVLLKDKEDWLDVPESVSGVKLFNGDSVKTFNKGKAKIHLLKESFLYLDDNSSISLKSLEEDDALQETEIDYLYGKVLFSVDRILNPKSHFSVQSNDIELRSRGGTFVLEGSQLQVLKGKMQIDKMSGNKIVTSTQVGVGQQIDLSPDSFGAFQEPIALGSEIYLDDFVKTGLGKMPIKEENPLSVLSTDDNFPETETDISAKDSSETTSSDKKNTNTENSLSISNEKNDDGIIEITEEPLEIKGEVSSNAVSVSINKYQLSKFTKGDTVWLYRAKESFKNLKEGKNEYEVVVEYEDGETLSENIIVDYKPEITDEDKEADTEEEAKTSSDTAADLPKNTSDETALTLNVISPEEGEKIDTDPVTIRGTAPAGTAKIMVGDYTLRTFKLGDAQWKYVASKAYGNLSPGEENKHLISAYDENDKEIASIQFSFFSTLIEDE